MKVRDALREGGAALSGSETPFLDASLLLADALATDRTSLLASGPESVGEGPLARYRALIASRSAGLPLAYIVGYKEFWGRRFAVDERALVPRPDTETLVAAALELGDIVAREGSTGSALRERVFRVHEPCCGSGCVAISVAADRPSWAVSASDLSEAALEVARGNEASLLEADRPGGPLAFAQGDLLSGAGESFDLIVANPPYVPSAEAEALLSLGWSEPRMALDGGADGLGLIRRLVPAAVRALAPGGALLVEADGDQAAEVADLFRASRFADIEVRRDFGGKARVTSGRKPWTP
jgi:release factor glutamine methyltransferase